MNLVDELEFLWVLIDAREITEEAAAYQLAEQVKEITNLQGARNLIRYRELVRYTRAARERGGEIHHD